MKTLFIILLMLTSSLVCADSSVILSKERISKVKSLYPQVNPQIFVLAKKGDLDSALKVSKLLFRLNDEDLVNAGMDLLKDYAVSYRYARLYLGLRYIEGVEIIPVESKPKRLLVDYDEAIKYLNMYLDDPIPEKNRMLYMIAFSNLGSAYAKREDYENAVNLFLGNIKLVEDDSTGYSSFELANLYRDGNGVEKNLEKAFFWYDISAKKGFNMSVMERNFLAIELGKN